MDFIECFNELLNPTEKFSEAHDQLLQIQKENPQLILDGLISIIENQETPENVRLYAIKSITMAAPVTNDARFPTMTLLDIPEVIINIADYLFPFLSREDKIGESAYATLRLYHRLIKTAKFYVSYLLPYVQNTPQDEISEFYRYREYELLFNTNDIMKNKVLLRLFSKLKNFIVLK